MLDNGTPDQRQVVDLAAARAAKAAARSSWRDKLAIHPAVEMFPPISRAELVKLGADIKTNGLISPIVLWLASKDAQAQLLDGRSRLDAIEIELGGPVRVTSRTFRGCTVWRLEADDDGYPPSVVDLLGNESCSLDARTVIVLDPGIDPYAYSIAVNFRRRHLTAGQKREVIANSIKVMPDKSDRQIASMLGVSHHTVGTVRAEMEGRGQIAHVETRIDTKGRQQPAKKVTAKPPPVSEEVLQRRAAAVERVRALTLAYEVGADAESLSGNANDGQSQLRHFEFQNIALRSENEELKVRIRDLEDRGLRAIPLAKLLDEVEHRLPATLPRKHLAALKALRGALAGHHVGPTLNLTTEEATTKH